MMVMVTGCVVVLLLLVSRRVRVMQAPDATQALDAKQGNVMQTPLLDVQMEGDDNVFVELMALVVVVHHSSCSQ